MELILLSGFISLLSLDITIAFQILISSPIFACSLLGWLLGDPRAGFEMGFLFQLLWLGRMPVGAYIVPEGNIASMIATSVMILIEPFTFPNTTMAVIFFLAIVVSYFGAMLTILYRKLNGKILNLVLREVERVHFNVMLFLEIGSMLIYLLGAFVFTYFSIIISLKVLPEIISGLGPDVEESFVIVKPLIVGIGLASIYPILKDALHKNPRKKVESR
jgi:mannose/fructose/N-acetylgalactosamine-specific phosphotransferase system component IIC